MKSNSPRVQKIMSLLWAGNTAEATRAIEQETAEAKKRMESLRQQMAALSGQLAEEEAALSDIALVLPPVVPELDASPAEETKAAQHQAQKTRSRRGRRRKSGGRGRLPAADRTKRRMVVIEAAKKYAAANGPKFTLADIAKLMAQEKFDLGVMEGRETTAIGGMLSKDPSFKLLERGVYEFQTTQQLFGVH